MFKKCFLCEKVIFKTRGKLAVQGEDYLIEKPLCKKCVEKVDQEYKMQSELREEMFRNE